MRLRNQKIYKMAENKNTNDNGSGEDGSNISMSEMQNQEHMMSILAGIADLKKSLSQLSVRSEAEMEKLRTEIRECAASSAVLPNSVSTNCGSPVGATSSATSLTSQTANVTIINTTASVTLQSITSTITPASDTLANNMTGNMPTFSSYFMSPTATPIERSSASNLLLNMPTTLPSNLILPTTSPDIVSRHTVPVVPTSSFEPLVTWPGMTAATNTIPHISVPTGGPRAPYFPQSTYEEDASRKMYPLPSFSGKPEDWPLFSVTFTNTTQEFRYNNAQNLIRLQKALQGNARQAVASLLIYPDDVPAVMEELQFNFGRPDILVKSQLNTVQQIRNISENNADGIIALSNVIRNMVSYFKSANCYQHLTNPMLVEQLVLKLPPSKQFEWSKYAATLTCPSVENLAIFLRELSKIVCLLPSQATNTGPRQSHFTSGNMMPTTSHNTRRLLQTSNANQPVSLKCVYCEKAHILPDCSDFKQISIDAKWGQVKQHRLCISCLKKGHQLANCHKRKSCAVNGCNKPHHPLLHSATTEARPQSEAENSPQARGLYNCCDSKNKHLFKILPVVLSGPLGKADVFAMFDDGSSVSLLEEKTAKSLGLKGQKTPLSLQWYDNQIKTEISRRVCVEITGMQDNADTFTIKGVRTVSSLDLPTQSFCKEDFDHTKILPILNYKNAKPVLLLGLDNCHMSIARTVVESGEDLPVATATKLGWVAFGPTASNSSSIVRICQTRETHSMQKISKLMEEYLSVENFGVRHSELVMESDDNKRAKTILETTKSVGQKYETGLLWRDDNNQMPCSYEMAKGRLLKVEAKMKRNPNYAKRYQEEINKYLQKDYARLLTLKETTTDYPRTWYLPHFGVENINEPDKLRIVFDAAAAVCGTSLNTMLLKGPEHAIPLIGVLIRFREGIYGVAGDIEEMFSRIKIREEDIHSQRFLWRDGDNRRAIQQYVMTSMIFGAVCSPCCAEYIKNNNAKQHMSIMPRGAEAIMHYTYVDDLVISFNDRDEAKQVVNEAIKINAKASFNLRNFVSNCSVLEEEFNKGKGNGNTSKFQLERIKKTDKILGLFWDKLDDSFRFQFKFHKIPTDVVNNQRAPTKREVLSIIMAIYDPFGFLANITVFPKVLMQTTWKSKLSWDEQLPENLYTKWQNWWHQFKQVEEFGIPRCYSSTLNRASDVQMHIFVDASVSAYAAVAYLRVKYNGEYQLSLVAAKSRVAPTKGMTIPRLELQAAVLGCRLKSSIMENITFKINSVTYWSDSKTVILWIRSVTRDYKQFVSVRIAEILSNSNVEQWRWLPSGLNVADDATRPEVPQKPVIRDRWVQEPAFLKREDEVALSNSTEDHENESNEYLLFCKKQVYSIFNFQKYSTYNYLLRVCARILRYVGNLRLKDEKRKSGELTAAELNGAEKCLCRLVQHEVYTHEVAVLVDKGRVPKSSVLYQITPYIDEEGIMRVHGRIDNANCLPYEVRRPIILSPSHHVTKLIVREFHENVHHQNEDLTINNIRQKFWIPRIRSLLKQVKRSCSTCVLQDAKPEAPLMGQLPEDRLTPYLRAFSYVGVDYCGPFQISIGRRREKRWVALFTCLNSRAIHLEIAADLSTDAFLICFRNFVNRRGTPVRIRSDNGTNFIRAKKELTADNRLFDPEAIQKEMAKKRIEWIFNCPANPHAGGCWERLIKCVKRLLESTLDQDAPKLDTFHSVLIEAENIVNSRPLTELPLSPHQAEPLTPNHYLLGCANSTQTPSLEIHPCMRKQWRIAQNLKDRLWKRWTLEYLPQLLTRPKWHGKVMPLKEDQLVLIVDPSQPRSQWQTGRIVRVFKAKDGQVRSAEVKTSHGLLRRPAVRLAVLNFSES